MLSKPLGSPDDSSSPREKPETLDSSVRATVGPSYLTGKLILRAIPVLRIYLRETKLVFCLFSVPQTSLTSLNKRISRGSVIVWGVSLIQMCSLCAGVSGFVCSTALYWMKLPDFLCLFLFLQMPGLHSPRVWTVTNRIISSPRKLTLSVLHNFSSIAELGIFVHNSL